MTTNNFNIKGLSDAEVIVSRKKHGENKLTYTKENVFIYALKNLATDPMIILLLVASIIYFLSGKTGDAIFLATAIVLVAAISFYQNARSQLALEKLKKFTQPNCKVIRNSEVEEIKIEELVIGDILLVEEGTLISADGIIIHSNDFSVNESILTGESMVVNKDITQADNHIYQGTTVSGGLAIATINAIGNQTKLGKIGKSLEAINEEKTPLEFQINNFVKKMAMIGAIIFFIVWIINYFKSNEILDSLLKALTLAMSILPEEIPIAFTTFMALGAWRLMKLGIVVKKMKTVETLGSATVICTDKTGTLTENKMSLAKIFVLSTNQIYSPKDLVGVNELELITLSMFASEPIPFDPMDIALHDEYKSSAKIDERPNYKMIYEYPLSGKPPMMTHIYENDKKNLIIAAKGAPEALIKVSNLTEIEKENITNAIKTLANEGYRVLGVGTTNFNGKNFPKEQQEFKFEFKGIVAFYDPPKKNIQAVLQSFYNAGISVKIITGDNAATTTAIAKQIGFKGYDKNISGDELMALSEADLQIKVLDIQIFTRMFPDAKLKIINALKAKNEIVAMTGDGVNDGPALKAAHIGIAMGKKGTEIAKQAASLILVEDDLSKMVDAIAMGRRIYSNLKKAIQYIISIHIPIILTVFIPLSLGWLYPNIFSLIHIVFLELIMGPTCSIIYENEPIEKNTMLQKPRLLTHTFFNWKELITSIIQGLGITLGALSIYQFGVRQGFNESLIRTMIFAVLIAANIFLTLVNRSFYYSIIKTFTYKNNLVLIIIAATIAFVSMLIYIKPLAYFFQFQSLNFYQLSISLATGFLSVMWYEILKWIKRLQSKKLILSNELKNA
jgi:Ca2+-transporting ATPase